MIWTTRDFLAALRAIAELGDDGGLHRRGAAFPSFPWVAILCGVRQWMLSTTSRPCRLDAETLRRLRSEDTFVLGDGRLLVDDVPHLLEVEERDGIRWCVLRKDER